MLRSLIAGISVLLLPTVVAHGQAPDRERGSDGVYRVRTTADRVAIVNAVLDARVQQFGQPLAVGPCSLATILGPGLDIAANLSPANRKRLLPKPDQCPGRMPARVNAGTVRLDFEKLGYESSEFITGAERVAPRETGLVVLTVLATTNGSEFHYEDWVMRKNLVGIWSVATIRMYDFAAQ